MQLDNLFHVPGEGGPYNIDGISCRSLVSTAIHAMIAFEMTDSGFNLDSLLQGFSEPGFFAVRMRRLSLLWNGDSFDA